MASLTSGSTPDGRTVSWSGLLPIASWAKTGPVSRRKLAVHRKRVIGNPAADLAPPTGLQATLFRQGRIAALRPLAAEAFPTAALPEVLEPYAQAAPHGMLLVPLPDGAVIHKANRDLLAHLP